MYYTSTHTSLPTRPHKRQIAGQGETQVHTLPCLPDRTKGRSPVREKHKYTHTSLPTRPHKRQIAGQGETQVHTHFPAYQTAQKADRRSGRNTSTHTLPCLPDRTKGRSPVRKNNTYMFCCCRDAHTCTLRLNVLFKSNFRFAEAVTATKSAFPYVEFEEEMYKENQISRNRRGDFLLQEISEFPVPVL